MNHLDSILLSIKRLLGIDLICEDFDDEIVIHINSVLVILSQLGVGPPGGFNVTDTSQTWSMFAGGRTDIEFIKTYVFMKVKLIFDPPQGSSAIESMNRVISELEWRINVAVDPEETTEGEEENADG